MTAQIFEQVKLESISEKGSYGIGLQIGQQLADSQMDISVEAVAKGIFDALNRNQPALEINDLMHCIHRRHHLSFGCSLGCDSQWLVGIPGF